MVEMEQGIRKEKENKTIDQQNKQTLWMISSQLHLSNKALFFFSFDSLNGISIPTSLLKKNWRLSPLPSVLRTGLNVP